MSGIPFIEEYKAAFSAAKESNGAEPDTGKQVIARIERALQQEYVDCLFCVDNGSGLDDAAIKRLYGSGVSRKGAGALGSVGHGHFTAFAPSDLRFVLYGGRNASGGQWFGGHAILAGHIVGNEEVGREARSADGFIFAEQDPRSAGQGVLFNEREIGSNLPDPLGARFGHGAGSVVMVSGYAPLSEVNGGAGALLAGAAAEHFLVAIHQSDLSVSVSVNEQGSVLDKSSLDVAVEQIAGKRERDRCQRSLKTLRDGETSTYEGASIWFRKEWGDGESGKSRVSVFRDGMWIEDNTANYLAPAKFAHLMPFDAVVNLPSDEPDSFGALVRQSEGASHKKIHPKEIADRKTRERLIEHLKGLQEHLASKGTPRDDSEDYIPPELALWGAPAAPIPPKLLPPPPTDEGDLEEGGEQSDEHDDGEFLVPTSNGGTPNSSENGDGHTSDPTEYERRHGKVKPGNNDGMAVACRPDAGSQNGSFLFEVTWKRVGERSTSRMGGGLRLALPAGTNRTSDVQVRPDYLKLASALLEGTDGESVTLHIDEQTSEAAIPPECLTDKETRAFVEVAGDEGRMASGDLGLVQAEIVTRKQAGDRVRAQ